MKKKKKKKKKKKMMMMMMKPAWLEGLMSNCNFFTPCGLHQSGRKNEMNVFCLHCCLSICPHCVPSHRSHPLLQIRRYVYHNVVRLGDLEKLIHCSYIQPYTINGAKVIFLNHRPQSRPSKAPSNVCLTCDRILQHPFHFCSLSCKVDHMVLEGADLSSILFRFDESDFAISQFEGLRMDASELTDDDAQITPNFDSLECQAYSISNEATSNSVVSQEPEIATRKKKKKKKNTSTNGFLPGIVLSLGSRRKGAPQRAPLS
ncbi:hypothetical protein SDJN02_04537, partial [Cucurbita argyrosperma subsp. argyrosperma]